MSASVDVVVTFSEPITTGSFAYTFNRTPTGLSVAWNGTSETATISHSGGFDSGQDITFTVTVAPDVSLNALAGAFGVTHPATFAVQSSSSRRTPEDTTPASLTIVYPNGGELFDGGERVSLVWTQVKTAGRVNVSFSTNEGESWEDVAILVQNTGAYLWTIPTSLSGEDVMIKVVATDLVTEVGDTTEVFFIEHEDTIEEQEEDEEVLEEEQPGEAGSGTQELGVAVGSLIKLADDGNPATFVDASVYFVSSDGKKHTFPSETIFRTWFTDFSSLQTVSAETLAAIPLGRNITFRPGVFMVKFTTSNKVYVIDRDQVLRWVQTEEIATALYGMFWNTLVRDIPDVFYKNYVIGTPIETSNEYNSTEIMEENTVPVE